MKRIPKGLTLLAATLVAAPAAAQFAPGAIDNARLVGVWTWTRPQNKCVETYDFRADGTLDLTSGAERTESTYRLQAKPTAQTQRYALSITVTKDYGGADCDGQARDDTGQSNTVYIQFDDSGRRGILICQDPISLKCLGPVTKKP